MASEWIATVPGGQTFLGETWQEAAWQAFAKTPRIRKVRLQRWDDLEDGRTCLGWTETVTRATAKREFENYSAGHSSMVPV